MYCISLIYLYYTWLIIEMQGIMEDLKVRNENNKILLQKTILEEYPVYMQMDLLNFLEKEKIIHKDSRNKNSENLLDITEIPTVKKD